MSEEQYINLINEIKKVGYEAEHKGHFIIIILLLCILIFTLNVTYWHLFLWTVGCCAGVITFAMGSIIWLTSLKTKTLFTIEKQERKRKS